MHAHVKLQDVDETSHHIKDEEISSFYMHLFMGFIYSKCAKHIISCLEIVGFLGLI